MIELQHRTKYMQMCYITRIPILLVYEVYTRSCRISTMSRNSPAPLSKPLEPKPTALSATSSLARRHQYCCSSSSPSSSQYCSSAVYCLLLMSLLVLVFMIIVVVTIVVVVIIAKLLLLSRGIFPRLLNVSDLGISCIVGSQRAEYLLQAGTRGRRPDTLSFQNP